MSEKMFSFMVRNTRTLEETRFDGQGETMDQAWKDSQKILSAPFRPKDGKGAIPIPLSVYKLDPLTYRAQCIVERTVKEFEGDGDSKRHLPAYVAPPYVSVSEAADIARAAQPEPCGELDFV